MIKINTPYGTLEVELYEKEVPHTVKNFNKVGVLTVMGVGVQDIQ